MKCSVNPRRNFSGAPPLQNVQIYFPGLQNSDHPPAPSPRPPSTPEGSPGVPAAAGVVASPHCAPHQPPCNHSWPLYKNTPAWGCHRLSLTSPSPPIPGHPREWPIPCWIPSAFPGGPAVGFTSNKKCDIEQHPPPCVCPLSPPQGGTIGSNSNYLSTLPSPAS